MSEITKLLELVAAGDGKQLAQLFDLLYNDLKRAARARISHEKSAESFHATDLLHEAYLRLVAAPENPKWNSKKHFFVVASKVMRRILVDRARSRNALKRGGEYRRVEIEDLDPQAPEKGPDLIVLDDALIQLAKVHPEKAELIDLRFFGGMNIEEAAEMLEISVSKAKRDWNSAKAWLLQQLDEQNQIR